MTTTMTSAAERTAADFLDALGRRDVAAALSLTAGDVSVTVHPLGVRGTGPAALRPVLDDLAGAFPDLLVTVQRLITTGDVVTALVKVEGTQAGEYAGVVNQEKHLDLDEAWRFTVADGVITAVTAYWCQQMLYRRLAVKRFDQVAIV
ncbi:MAG TPA: nuclear transport factor 2 family protein [Trebonia sp.]|nr:nuclear transport factor 2 family protein [Trebonia sp.]